MTQQSDLIIVGGGIAGLTAATFAAHAGLRPLLFERSATLGGRARTQERGGFLLNLGPHALYRAGAGAATLSDLGLALPGGSPATSGYAIVRGRRTTLPSSPLTAARTGALSLRGKAELARAIRSVATVDTSPLQGATLATWISTVASQVEVRNALSAFFRVSTYSNAPEIESAGAAIDQFRMARAGVTYLDGGWRSIVDALSGLARKDGAVIEEQRKIVALLPGGPGWRAVLDDGTTHDAPAVILALSPADATRLLDPAPPALAAAAVRLRPVSAASLDLGLNSLPNRKGNFALGFDQPTYLSAHSLAARLGPPRAALVTVARYLGTENPPADETLTILEATMGLVHPGWRDFVVEHRYLPHLTVTHAIVTADGGGLAGRPGPAVPGAPGLYIAGDWVGGEGMLADAAFASGRLAASLAAQALREPGAIRIHAAPRAR